MLAILLLLQSLPGDTAARIDRVRKADLRVLVEDAAGHPAAGARVHVRMKRHKFGFGTAVAASALLTNNGTSARCWNCSTRWCWRTI